MPPQLEDMGNSLQNNVINGEINPVPVGDIKNGNIQTTLPVEDSASSTATGSKEKLSFDLNVSVLFITMSMVPLMGILFLHGPTPIAKLELTLKLSAFFAFIAFLSAISLLFRTLKLMAIKPARLIPKSLLRASKILFATATASLFLTCISITYSLLPKAYYFLPLALLPSLLVAGLHFLYRAETDHGEISPAQSKARKKELKRATQLTLSLISTSFSGFIGIVLAIYHKAASLDGEYSYVKVSVSVSVLLGGDVAGVLALILCRMLSSNDGHRRSGTWQRAILAAASIVMLAMLVSAIIIIAETIYILHGLLVAAVFPVIAGASAWLLVEFCTVAGADGGCTETEDGNTAHGTMYTTTVAVASVSFGAILATFAGMLSGAVSKEQLKACTILLASSLVAAVSLGVVTSVTAPRAEKAKASTAFAATVLACFGLGTLVVAALDLDLFYQIAA